MCTLAGDAYCNYFGTKTMKAIALAAKNFKKGALDKDDDEYYTLLLDDGMDDSRKVCGVVRMQRSRPRVFFVFAVCATKSQLRVHATRVRLAA